MGTGSTDRVTVVVGGSYWALNGVNVFSVNLVRGLREKGIAAHILLTEEHSALIRINDARMLRPADVPFVELPVEGWRSWGAHWGAMIRYLEDCAPCVYIPNSDWRHSCVSPLLSDEVRIVGVVHSDDPLHYDHVARLGKYWDAIATTSPTIARKTLALDPTLRDRTEVIAIGVDIPLAPIVRIERPHSPLRVIYPGSLKQHQKRVLDLPKIVEAAARKGVSIALTIAGGGPDEDRLREASRALVERGLITFLGVVEHSRLLDILEEQDVFIMTSEFEGMPNALLEAMGRGCVPLVTDMESAVPELVRDGVNGYVVPIGGIDAFVDRLRDLGGDANAWTAMSLRAYEAVSTARFRVQDMVDSYADLIARVTESRHRATYTRPRGVLNHPPAEVAGVRLFPLELPFEAPEIGRFPDELRDYREFTAQIRHLKRPDRSPLGPAIRRDPAPDLGVLDGVEVVVATPAWTRTPVNHFSATLVRELRARGLTAHILLTEDDTERVEQPAARMPRPPDVPIDTLPVGASASWGAHWGAMVRYLEERAPCIYLPNDDWRHSCVSPLLSDRVAVVGTVPGDDALHSDHVRRLGRYWDAIVAHDPELGRSVLRADPSLAGRVSVVPYGLRLPEQPPERRSDPGSPLQALCLGALEPGAPALVASLAQALNRKMIPVDLHVFESLPHHEAAHVFERCDVVLVLSRFPCDWQTLAEAVGAGCVPVLVQGTRTGDLGHGLILDGDSGYVVRDGHLDALVDALTALHDDPASRQQMAVNAYHLVMAGHYRSQDMAQGYMEAFARALTAVRQGAYRRPRG